MSKWSQHSEGWSPRYVTVCQDRGHNIINGADNTLTYEVARPWEEVQGKGFVREDAGYAINITWAVTKIVVICCI